MKYAVTAISFDLDAHKPTVARHPRTEIVDTASNPIFGGCRGPWDVEDRYEAFWNRLNATDQQRRGACTNPNARVKVVLVKEVP